jgi:hypothetical protein
MLEKISANGLVRTAEPTELAVRRIVMSASNEWTQWHLTPRGWERGTEHWDHRTEEREIPPDRVLTVQIGERYPSVFSKPQQYSDEVWRLDDAAQVGKLFERFGYGPPKTD